LGGVRMELPPPVVSCPGRCRVRTQSSGLPAQVTIAGYGASNRNLCALQVGGPMDRPRTRLPFNAPPLAMAPYHTSYFKTAREKACLAAEARTVCPTPLT
jgi:hypothetical protein